jgi:hypothetical protein
MRRRRRNDEKEKGGRRRGKAKRGRGSTEGSQRICG